MVVSVPRELSSDHSAVLLLAEASGRVMEAEISDRLRWEGDRPQRVLDELMQVRTWPSTCAEFGHPSAKYLIQQACGRIFIFMSKACLL